MSDFVIHFFVCNIIISGIIGFLLVIKRLFRNFLTPRVQYNLWFLFLLVTILPFLPLHISNILQNISIGRFANQTTILENENLISTASNITEDSFAINDFAVSLTKNIPQSFSFFFFAIWIVGMIIMFLLALKSFIRLKEIKKSALPVQNQTVIEIFKRCLIRTKIKETLPIYSTAYLKNPIMVGVFSPAIYLPIHLISDFNETDMMYILLHELNHYTHKDAIINYIQNVCGIVYWFNPMVWVAIRKIRSDRELACDSSVLELLEEDAYISYGNTLLTLAEKVSLSPFPFSLGMGGGFHQMKQRILNIKKYKKPGLRKKLGSMVIFLLVGLLTLNIAPVFSVYASNDEAFHWNTDNEDISYINLASRFGNYDGAFVLYDITENRWLIYNEKNALKRVSPESTYKIYSALIGLDEQVITPSDNLQKWDRTAYPFQEWESDQTLSTAMAASVNWYFQNIDAQLGSQIIYQHLKELNYGNMMVGSSLDHYWMESTLKISSVEQVKLLSQLYADELPFDRDSMRLVKDSILISDSNSESVYGKTGTGRVNDKDINGWFVGYIQKRNHTYIFATNIQSDQDATGIIASEITLNILSELDIISSSSHP